MMLSNNCHFKSTAFATSYFVLLAELLKRRGISLETWLGNSGITRNMLESAEGYIDIPTATLLIERALTLTQDDALGIYYGQLLNLNAHGILGFAGLLSPTVEAALKIGFKYVETRSPVLSLKLTKEKRYAIIQITIKVGLSPKLEQFAVEAVFNSFAAMSTYLFGNNSPDVIVNTTINKPAHASLYTIFYPGSVTFKFAQKQHQIILPIDFLQQTLTSADSQALKLVEQRISMQLDKIRIGHSKQQHFAQYIQEWLDTSPGYFPTIEQVASQLNTTPRTLHRKLKQEGVTYSQIIDRIRLSKAKQYLKDTELSILQISNLLSYNDSSNFARAFKKWTGTSPLNFRKNDTLDECS